MRSTFHEKTLTSQHHVVFAITLATTDAFTSGPPSPRMAHTVLGTVMMLSVTESCPDNFCV